MWGVGVEACVLFSPSPLPFFLFSSLFPRSSDVGHRIKARRQAEEGREDINMEDVLDGFQQRARDHARIPMQASLIPFETETLHSYVILVQRLSVRRVKLAIPTS